MSFIQCSSSLFENRPISIHPWLPGVRSQYTWGKITVVCTLLCGWLHERARWMKPSGLIGYPCWSGECNVVLSWLSTASRKNDVFSPDKMYKTSCIKRHKIFGKNENENFTNSFLNFRKKNKMEILLFKVIIQFWKKNENWNSFANSTFIPSLMSSRDRRPGDAPTTWCLLPLQRWLSGILPSTWSSSQRGEREERMERKLRNEFFFQIWIMNLKTKFQFLWIH